MSVLERIVNVKITAGDDPDLDPECRKIAAEMRERTMNVMRDAPKMTVEEAEDACARVIAKGIIAVATDEQIDQFLLLADKKDPGA